MIQSRAVRTLVLLAAAMFVGAVALMMMNTAPIRVDAVRPAIATEAPADYTKAVALPTPMRLNAWRHVVIHSHAADTTAVWNQCHFVIDEDAEGNVLVRPTELWTQQRAGRHANVAGHDYNTDGIGISLAGDFDLHAPTPTQMKALTELVKKLQLTCGIDHDRVYLYRELARSTEPGAKFRAGDFHSTVLRIDR